MRLVTVVVTSYTHVGAEFVFCILLCLHHTLEMVVECGACTYTRLQEMELFIYSTPSVLALPLFSLFWFLPYCRAETLITQQKPNEYVQHAIHNCMTKVFMRHHSYTVIYGFLNTFITSNRCQ